MTKLALLALLWLTGSNVDAKCTTRPGIVHARVEAVSRQSDIYSSVDVFVEPALIHLVCVHRRGTKDCLWLIIDNQDGLRFGAIPVRYKGAKLLLIP